MSTQVMKGKHRAFVFVDAAPGKDRKVLEKLLKYDEVIEAHLIPVSMMCLLSWSSSFTDVKSLPLLKR